MSQNQFDSLVSFVFNEGRDALARSVLAQRIKNKDFADAANEFSKWVYARSPTGAGKVKSQGLINRRKEEEAYFRYGTNPY